MVGLCCVKDIVAWLEELFPPSLAEDWDFVGLQVGDPEAHVERVLISLDPTLQAVREAVALNVSLLITHHPVWLGPLPSIRRYDPVGAIIWEAVRGGVSLLCAHTNLDNAPMGSNELLAQRLELVGPVELEGGGGRVGDLSQCHSLESFCRWVGSRVGVSQLRVSGSFLTEVRRVAVCSGSGASLLEAAARGGAQALVTGDGKYHDARKAEALGIALVDVGHFASERILVPWLAGRLSEASGRLGWGLTVMEHRGEDDPFRVFEIERPGQ